MPDGDLTSFLERVREDAGQESMTHDAGDCADWRNSCPAHSAARLAGMVGGVLGLADEWDAKAKKIGGQIALKDCDGATAGFKMIGYQNHRDHAAALRQTITAALTGKEAGDG